MVQSGRLRTEQAIERLYALEGLPPPAVIWCQSLYQLLAAPSIVIGMLHSDLWYATEAELLSLAHSPTEFNKGWDKAWPAIWLTCGFPIVQGLNATSRIAEFHGHLEGALTLQLKREIGKALQSGRLRQSAVASTREIYRRFWLKHPPGVSFAISRARSTEWSFYEVIDTLPDGQRFLAGGERASALGNGVCFLYRLLGARLGAEGDEQMRRVVPLPWEPYWTQMYRRARLAHPEAFESIHSQVEIWTELSSGSGGIMCTPGVAFACEKPIVFRLSRDLRLHCENGPALAFSDGFEVYGWHGTIVPARVVEAPESITVEDIDREVNAEVRRVMIERYGTARYIIDSGAELVHQDDFGSLYRRELPGDEALVMVKVVNSTPEPDGTYKDYFLRVPPNIVTAKEAVAWTFGLQSIDYDPSVQT